MTVPDSEAHLHGLVQKLFGPLEPYRHEHVSSADYQTELEVVPDLDD